jgi:hypothetical protein
VISERRKERQKEKSQRPKMHLPSFFVGSIVSGTGFLLIHRELSHRERLSKKWVLREKVEEEAMKIWQEARKSIPGNINNVSFVKAVFDYYSSDYCLYPSAKKYL